MKVYLLVLTGLVIPSLVSAQGLGDAAQKEKERRKQVAAKASPVPSYTNEDAVASKGSLANDPNGTPPPTSKSTSSSSAAGKDEATWRSRYSLANARLTTAKAVWDKIQGVKMKNESYVRAKTELDNAQKGLDDLIEEGRRAGVPPGWLR